MPETSPSCTNCGALSVGAFCPSCGQKSGDLHVSLRAFAEDALGTLISFDNRIARTLIPLLRKPGLVSAETLDGKRARYVPPMRLYLIVSFAFFLTLKMVGGAITTSEGKVSNSSKGIIHFTVSKPEQESDSAEQDSAMDPQPSKENSSMGSAATAIDSASTSEPEVPDSSENPSPERETRSQVENGPQADNNLAATNADASASRIGQLIHRAVTAIDKDKERATEVLLRRLAWAFFLLPPIAAIWLRLLFRKRDKYYVPHLVISLHLHSAVMLFLTLRNLTDLLPGPNLLGVILTLWIPPYVVLSVHRIYKMRWLSTLWRLVVLGLLHSVVLLIAFVGSLILTGLALS